VPGPGLPAPVPAPGAPETGDDSLAAFDPVPKVPRHLLVVGLGESGALVPVTEALRTREPDEVRCREVGEICFLVVAPPVSRTCRCRPHDVLVEHSVCTPVPLDLSSMDREQDCLGGRDRPAACMDRSRVPPLPDLRDPHHLRDPHLRAARARCTHCAGRSGWSPSAARRGACARRARSRAWRTSRPTWAKASGRRSRSASGASPSQADPPLRPPRPRPRRHRAPVGTVDVRVVAGARCPLGARPRRDADAPRAPGQWWGTGLVPPGHVDPEEQGLTRAPATGKAPEPPAPAPPRPARPGLPCVRSRRRWRHGRRWEPAGCRRRGRAPPAPSR